MKSRTIALLLLMALVILFHFFRIENGTVSSNIAASLGLVILAGYLCGELGSFFKLPRLTGYLIAGIAAGPYCSELLTHQTVKQLNLIDQIALAMIALSAGGEFHLATLKSRLKGIVWIMVCQTIGIFCFGSVSFYILSSWIPFLDALSSMNRIAASIAFGVMAVAQSPATTIAIITETKSAGLMTDTLLGITVIIDIVVIILFAILIPFLRMIEFGQGGMNWGFLLGLFNELSISFLTGMAAGSLISVYLQYVQKNQVLFVLIFSYLVSEGAKAFHLDTLIICITAGVWVTNASKRGEALIQMVEDSSLIVYVIFFTITGAALNLNALQSMFGMALLLVTIRLVMTAVTTYCGAKLSGENYPMPQWLWLLFLPQAGVSLGLLAVLSREGFAWGAGMQTLMVAVIAINQLGGPILMKTGLSLYGETGKSKRRKMKED